MKRIKGMSLFVGRLWSHKQGKIGLIMVSVLILVAVFAPFIAPFNPYDVSERTTKGLAPSAKHWLGTTINTGQTSSACLSMVPGCHWLWG